MTDPQSKHKTPGVSYQNPFTDPPPAAYFFSLIAHSTSLFCSPGNGYCELSHCTAEQGRGEGQAWQKRRRCAVGRCAEQVPKEGLARFLEVPNPEGRINSGALGGPQAGIRTPSLGPVTNHLNTFSLLNTRFTGPSNRGFHPEAP